MRTIIIALLLSISCNVFAGLERIEIIDRNNQLNALLLTLVAYELLNDRYNQSSDLGQAICQDFGGGSSCFSVNSIGEGICRAGGGSSCFSVNSIGEGICRAGGGSSCFSVNSIGEGICRAGGGSSCFSVNSIGEGICRAGGGSSCFSVNSIGEGICRGAGGSSCFSVSSVEDGFARAAQSSRAEDYEHDWDAFYAQDGILLWRCRGVQTGQFAPDQLCFGKIQVDNRWPDK